MLGMVTTPLYLHMDRQGVVKVGLWLVMGQIKVKTSVLISVIS